MGSKSRSASTTTNKAFNFNNVDYGQDGGGGGVAKNINLAESSLAVGDVIMTDQGAVTGALDLAGKVNQTSADTLLALGDNAYDDLEDSRELTRDLFGGAVESVNSANREALQFLTQNTDRALAFATKATRTESEKIAENMTTYFVIAGGLLLAVTYFGSRK